jgi:antitoxin (DNA-binding transcriptional repressor) of toxin-antitoxin stability system
MTSVTVAEAQAKLLELIQKLSPGEEVLIVQDGVEVAKLAKSGARFWPCKAGSYQKVDFWMAPDFDGPLDDFKEYME